MLHFLAALAILSLSFATPAQALLLYGKDNSGNLADPASGVPWGNVAEIVNSSGGAITGSAVYLGDRFLLTADHVTLRTHVSFDGSTYLPIDATYTPVQIAPADLKLFKLENDPGLPTVPLYEGSAEVGLTSTLVGWGVGRDPLVPVFTDTVNWGTDATVAKRWGTNIVAGTLNNLNALGYVYSALRTVLANTVGADEAAATAHDSGAGLFVFDGGKWQLAGVFTSTEPPSGSSTFGADTLAPGGQENYLVRISTYRSLIETTLPVELLQFYID
ncbi:MAG: hypothetical protein ACI8TX_003940 [Hyphomicrobiaceae bacterium]|jgi:hypothetical protein